MSEMNRWAEYLRSNGLNIKVTTNPKYPAMIGASHIEYNEGRIGIRRTEHPFTLYSEGDKWICQLGGPGQMTTMIYAADYLENACNSILGYLELVKTDDSVPAKLLIKLFQLQERGYDIRIDNHEHIVVKKINSDASENYADDYEIVLEMKNGVWTSSLHNSLDAADSVSLETLLDEIR